MILAAAADPSPPVDALGQRRLHLPTLSCFAFPITISFLTTDDSDGKWWSLILIIIMMSLLLPIMNGWSDHQILTLVMIVLFSTLSWFCFLIKMVMRVNDDHGSWWSMNHKMIDDGHEGHKGQDGHHSDSHLNDLNTFLSYLCYSFSMNTNDQWILMTMLSSW